MLNILNLTFVTLVTLWPVGGLFIQRFLSHFTESLRKADIIFFTVSSPMSSGGGGVPDA